MFGRVKWTTDRNEGNPLERRVIGCEGVGRQDEVGNIHSETTATS